MFCPVAVNAWAGIGFTFIIISNGRRERAAESPRLSEADVGGGNRKEATPRGLIGCLYKAVRKTGTEW